ncbi:MAG TPA: hypothetical protein VII23_04870 [Terriglobales bacterium]
MAKKQPLEQVKITAFVPRELWARTRAEAVRSSCSARDILARALEAYLRTAGGKQ